MSHNTAHKTRVCVHRYIHVFKWLLRVHQMSTKAHLISSSKPPCEISILLTSLKSAGSAGKITDKGNKLSQTEILIHRKP